MMVSGDISKFKSPEVVLDHYMYRGAVYDHNSLKHDGGNKSQFGSKSKWGTTWGPIQVFTFFVACTEVNAYLGMKYFLKTNDKFIDS